MGTGLAGGIGAAADEYQASTPEVLYVRVPGEARAEAPLIHWLRT